MTVKDVIKDQTSIINSSKINSNFLGFVSNEKYEKI